MKRTASTFSVALMIASSLLLLAQPLPATSAAAGPTPSPASPKSSASQKTPKSDICGDTKSKWAHLQCEQFNSSAPGDEYFGRMKMSYLGIDNTYKDGAVSAGAYTTDPHVIAKLDFATEALRRWAAKYPNDPQLARSYFLAIQVLRKVYTQTEQQTTWEFMQLLVGKYSSTYFGKVMKASLARGFTEHWFALAQICPTPLPLGVMPEATPNATASPSPAPGQPSVDLITPPCVQASPVPEMTEAPAPQITGAPVPQMTQAPLPSGHAATPAPQSSAASPPAPSPETSTTPSPLPSPTKR